MRRNSSCRSWRRRRPGGGTRFVPRQEEDARRRDPPGIPGVVPIWRRRLGPGGGTPPAGPGVAVVCSCRGHRVPFLALFLAFLACIVRNIVHCANSGPACCRF